MKHYCYCVEFVIACMAFADMEAKKSATEYFLKAFGAEYDIEKITPDPKETASFYYEVLVTYKHYNTLKVYRFAESLQLFCRYWNIPVHSEDLFGPK